MSKLDVRNPLSRDGFEDGVFVNRIDYRDCTGHQEGHGRVHLYGRIGRTDGWVFERACSRGRDGVLLTVHTPTKQLPTHVHM
jgi:hypothetical protein